MQKEKRKVNRTILAITDFSKSSTTAILFAARLFKNSKRKIIFLNVFENPNDKSPLLISVEDILIKDSEAGLKKQSTEVETALKTLKFSSTRHSMAGKLRKAIRTITQFENVDLIVAGIPANRYPCKNLNNAPLLFMGQSKYPILIVPEKCSHKPVKSILVVNLAGHPTKNSVEKGFEYIINPDHISKHLLSLNEKKIDNGIVSSLHKTIKEKDVNLIIIIPAAGDKIDRALRDYQVQELCHFIASLLSY
jgi:hypothetical protein